MTARSPNGAERVGTVYLSQLCDLVSVVTRSPVWFYAIDESLHEERIRPNRRTAAIDRILTEPEWSWITGNLAFLRRDHPRFLAAASWYRKGLLGKDALDDFCCFWRVIERLAFTYADKSAWPQEEKSPSARKHLEQLAADLFHADAAPKVLSDCATVTRLKKLRDDLSHGNISITPEVIDAATEQLKPLEEAAYSVLQKIRLSKLTCEIPM